MIFAFADFGLNFKKWKLKKAQDVVEFFESKILCFLFALKYKFVLINIHLTEVYLDDKILLTKEIFGT